MDKKNDFLNSEKAFHILKEIENNQNISQRDLSKKLDISLGKTNFFLNAFIEKGMVKITKFKNDKHKLGYMKILTPHGIKKKIELTYKLYLKKSAEYEALKRDIAGLKNSNSNKKLFT